MHFSPIKYAEKLTLMKIFDYSFIKTLLIPSDFLSSISLIYGLKSKSDSLKSRFPDVFTGLRKIAIVESVKGRNAIEGIITSDSRIKAIVNGISAPKNHSEEEIAGYRDALNFIHQNHDSLSFSEELIKELHMMMLSHTGLSYGGEYKSEDNIIRERWSNGMILDRWKPTPAKVTPRAMEQLVEAFLEARDDSSINQLLLIPSFILDFLYVHPFGDGNRRISRLLTLFLLYQAGFDVPEYISFEEQINKDKIRYYEALKKSSVNWHEGNNNYLPFINNTIFTLSNCYQELNKRFLTLRDGKVSKTERIENAVLTSLIPISKADIVYLLPDVSVTTIEAVLAKMVKESKIAKIGSTKGVKYKKI